MPDYSNWLSRSVGSLLNLITLFILRIFLAGFLFLLPAPAFSQDIVPLQKSIASFQELASTRPSVFDSSPYVEGGCTADYLTKERPDWSSQYLDLFIPLKAYGIVNVLVENVHRFLQSDQAITLTYIYPVSSGIITLDGGYTQNPKFLADNSVGVEWNGSLPQGFGYILGFTHRRYAEDVLNIYSVGAEKYISAFRLAYTASIATIDNSQGEFAQKVQFQWVSAFNNRFGVTYALGGEPTVISPGNLSAIQTQYVQLDGLYWVTKKVGLTGALWHGKEGYYYQRNGGELGLRVLL